jgi:hypothetical protein
MYYLILKMCIYIIHETEIKMVEMIMMVEMVEIDFDYLLKNLKSRN